MIVQKKQRNTGSNLERREGGGETPCKRLTVTRHRETPNVTGIEGTENAVRDAQMRAQRGSQSRESEPQGRLNNSRVNWSIRAIVSIPCSLCQKGMSDFPWPRFVLSPGKRSESHGSLSQSMHLRSRKLKSQGKSPNLPGVRSSHVRKEAEPEIRSGHQKWGSPFSAQP